MKKTLCSAILAVVVLLSLSIGTGCEWLGAPNELVEYKRALDASIVETQFQLEGLRSDVKKLQSLPDLTPEENRLLQDYLVLQSKVEAGLEKTQKVVDLVSSEIGGQETNAGALIQLGLGIAAAFGLPYVGLIGAFIKRGQQFTALSDNITDATTDKSKAVNTGNTLLTLDGTLLKSLNIAAGIERKIAEARREHSGV